LKVLNQVQDDPQSPFHPFWRLLNMSVSLFKIIFD
jgi:hypothetical protein